MSDTILIVDDESAIRHAIVRAFPAHSVIEADTIAQALERMADGYPDLVLLDQQLPDGQGIEAITRIRAIDPEIPVLLLTGHGSTDLAVEALKNGIEDYLEKPFKIERLRRSVELLLDRQRLGRQVAKLTGRGSGRSHMVASSAGMKKVVQLIKRVAAVPATTVLIQGESGVGKELVARAIHERSSRTDKPFIAINCAALSEHLLEAELFGYEKGAFTGADTRGKAGLFEAANGGTILLDEVGEMPLNLQTKLLRVLQERRFRRVGGLEDQEVDMRVVAATNRDLRREVAAGRFRQDLYYRLRVVPILVPPLRERPDDILPLAENLRERLAEELGRPDARFSPEAQAAMRSYAWPGNVRELANAVERGLIAAAVDVIDAEDLVMDEEIMIASEDTPALAPGTIILPPDLRNLAEIENMVVAAALRESNGQKSRAADMLGINRTTLYNKIRQIGLMTGG